jgi:hypothetical protein
MLLLLSVVNNVLSLYVFQRCKRLRRTNIGVYLTVYATISIIGSVLLVVGQAIQYFQPYPFANNAQLSETFYCYVKRSGEQVTGFLCLSLGALVAIEHGLILYFNCRMTATRRRSVIACLLVFVIVATTSIPMLIFRCELKESHTSLWDRITSRWFYTAGFLAGIIYFIAIVLILVSFALRIHVYGTTQQSKKKMFFKLVSNHLFVFIPPVIYLLCLIPYQIWYLIKRGEQAFFYCGISAVEYTFKIMAQALSDVPAVITWLIFVYPSNVYMTEFYTETWLGKHAKQTLISLGFFKWKLSLKGQK